MRSLLGAQTIVRVDRLGPSKNVALGFRAFGLLLERPPDLVGRVCFLAFPVPSRETLEEYRSYAWEVWQAVEAVNTQFGREGWKPIEVFYEDNRSQAIAGMSLADVLVINPVPDGMNLVAKEGSIVNERDAVLVLSRECGAHAQLGSAVLAIAPPGTWLHPFETGCYSGVVSASDKRMTSSARSSLSSFRSLTVIR